MIPIDSIHVLNPRARNKRQAPRDRRQYCRRRPQAPDHRNPPTSRSGVRYDLVCGEGRLEAFRLLGEHEIPATSSTPSSMTVWSWFLLRT
jgi:ParB family transcriptional regulator, chromosome partitioning protein